MNNPTPVQDGITAQRKVLQPFALVQGPGDLSKVIQ